MELHEINQNTLLENEQLKNIINQRMSKPFANNSNDNSRVISKSSSEIFFNSPITPRKSNENPLVNQVSLLIPQQFVGFVVLFGL